MHPEAERLASAFIAHFWSADHEIRWGNIEQEYALWLDDSTVVVGKVDADGVTPDGEPFFADWKTGSKGKARFINDEKAKWRMSPQALTYGLFKGDSVRRFLVRWALKTEPVTCDYEWYTYSKLELDVWRDQLLRIAANIRAERKSGKPFELNLSNCARFGERYACKFRDDGCHKGNFNFIPVDMVKKEESHIALEAGIRLKHKDNKKLVVLGSSRVGDWLHCHEFYRRLNENSLTETSEALNIGTDFHSLIAAHLTNIKKGK